ncbi:hypothetical protein ISP15_17620 [Dyella jejuensis]|uniref:Uncharacterized protein n=1 Tax=Dyella jejuensis TaxID=1432009 RepID=A0ABW8JME4_9GAMM
MATHRIAPSSSLIEILRTLARERTQATSHGSHTHRPDADNQLTPVSRKHDVLALRERLRGLAEGADSFDTQAMSQAKNQVIREILLWEFGNDFRVDSQFLPMVDAIDKTLDADAGLKQRFIDLIVDLRK